MRLNMLLFGAWLGNLRIACCVVCLTESVADIAAGLTTYSVGMRLTTLVCCSTGSNRFNFCYCFSSGLDGCSSLSESLMRWLSLLFWSKAWGSLVFERLATLT